MSDERKQLKVSDIAWAIFWGLWMYTISAGVLALLILSIRS